MKVKWICLGLLPVFLLSGNVTPLTPQPLDQTNANPTSTFNDQQHDELRKIAESITVKVKTGLSWGSGVIIKHSGQKYIILTNEHVLISGDDLSYQVQTHDGKTHVATRVKIARESEDIALLQINTNQNYPVAQLAKNPNLEIGSLVVSAGFPVDLPNLSHLDPKRDPKRGFVMTSGQIIRVMNRAFVGGYQLGYSNEVGKGMSGGPVLNNQGKVIAINALHKYPLWGNPYIFQDGTTLNEVDQNEIIQLSWGIPVQILRSFIK